jgi:hypothetical protein
VDFVICLLAREQKEYKKQILRIETEQMIASSTPSVKYSNDKVDNEVEALGKERGSFGDLW